MHVNPEQEVIKLYAKQLKLATLANIDDLVRQAEENGQGYTAFLSEVLKREINQREENRQRRNVRQARFPLEKTLDTLDLNRFEKVEAAVIWQLATGDFVKRRENVIMIGSPGTGKSHLSIGLGRRMCGLGFKVRFYNAGNLAAELTEAQHARSLLKLEKSLTKLDLLILDELSYLSFTRDQAELLFHVLSERNERGSVIITTNLEFSRWTDIFPDPMLTAALIDRLTHRAYILDMNGPSYRLEQRIKKKREGGEDEQ
jgi:DNA replication protein DnaC